MVPGRYSMTKTALFKALRAHPAQVQNSGKLVLRATRNLHLPRQFGKISHAHRIRATRPDALTPQAMGRFVFDATIAILLKQVRGSRPSMASAYNCYASFCKLRRNPPPTFQYWERPLSDGF